MAPPSKKQKTGSSSAKAELTAALASNASLNPLADLLHIASSTSDPNVALKAIFALYRLFTLCAQKGLLSAGANAQQQPARKAVRAWVAARLDAFADLLCALLKDDEKTLRTSSLKILFSLLRQLSSVIPAPSSAATSSSSAAPLRFDVPFFIKIVKALLICPPSSRTTSKSPKSVNADGILDPDVCDLFLNSSLNPYADIRWFFLRESAALLESPALVSAHPAMPANALSILEKLSGMPPAVCASSETAPKQFQFWIEQLDAKPRKSKRKPMSSSASSENSDADADAEAEAEADDWRAFFEDPKPSKKKEKGRRLHTLSVHAQLHTPAAHRAVFTRCWLALLPLLSAGMLDEKATAEDEEHLALVARALTVLHHGVLPHLTRAVLIMDWVSGCVDHGGNVGLLALNALFVLMREYNLDYPQFYTRLYAFLDRDVLHLRHRARFFRLTELFLSSSHLPATLLASFVKRLARLSLSAPPAAIIMAIPFTYNVLKRHPALMVMIHRDADVESSAEEDDAFDPSEPNPTQTGALRSSLWELATHRQHYHGAVATLARVFEEAFTRPGYAMEDFLDHTYATLFETEANRKIRKDPPVIELGMVQPMMVRARGNEDANAGVQTDIVGTMWVFG
ncbi:CBF-domain-containing protein [Phellopilus nigrolimitatus]|nr:CBF-domain-containing protein [Phellopilus nigrolimitatus]